MVSTEGRRTGGSNFAIIRRLFFFLCVEMCLIIMSPHSLIQHVVCLLVETPRGLELPSLHLQNVIPVRHKSVCVCVCETGEC